MTPHLLDSPIVRRSSSSLPPTTRLTKFLNHPKKPSTPPLFPIKAAKRQNPSRGLQKQPNKDLSRILRTEAATNAIERKAHSHKYKRLWPKAVLDALDEAIRENRWETALKDYVHVSGKIILSIQSPYKYPKKCRLQPALLFNCKLDKFWSRGFMRRPPLLRRSEYLNMLNDLHDFETKRHREGFPVENFVQQKIEACRSLQKLGENYTEQYLMTKIVELLSPSWNHVKDTIFENRVINNAIDLMNTLMYEERNVHPLWIEFEQGQMMPNSTVREHILDKEKQFHNLKKKGFKPHIVILVKAIVKNLPPTWPKSKVFVSLKEKFPDLRELGAMLEEIENDMICLQALEEAEKQLNHQEEKHDQEDKEKHEQEDRQEKHQQKGVKRKLEFDDP